MSSGVSTAEISAPPVTTPSKSRHSASFAELIANSNRNVDEAQRKQNRHVNLSIIWNDGSSVMLPTTHKRSIGRTVEKLMSTPAQQDWKVFWAQKLPRLMNGQKRTIINYETLVKPSYSKAQLVVLLWARICPYLNLPISLERGKQTEKPITGKQKIGLPLPTNEHQLHPKTERTVVKL